MINQKDNWEIIKHLQEGIWMIDSENYTTFVNQAMAEMLGYEPEVDFEEGLEREVEFLKELYA